LDLGELAVPPCHLRISVVDFLRDISALHQLSAALPDPIACRDVAISQT
jgi:hypothetical protein